jgi:hypothetical protein
LVCVDVGEDLVMVDDVVTPLNPLITPIEEEKLEELMFDVNVFQWSHDKKPFKRVVRTRVNHSA